MFSKASTGLTVIFLVMLTLLQACSETPVNFEFTAKVILNDRPVLGARIMINGLEAGTTDLDGKLKVQSQGMRGQELPVVIVLDTPHLKSKPWIGKLNISRNEQEEGARYHLDATLRGFVTIVARRGASLLPDTAVLQEGVTLGRTDTSGEFEYVYDRLPGTGVNLTLSKLEYVDRSINVNPDSPQRLEVGLMQQAVISLSLLSLNRGAEEPLYGAEVSLDGRKLGKTDKEGRFSYRHQGKHGGEGKLQVTARGYVPDTWSRTIMLEGRHKLTRYFLPDRFVPVKTAVWGFVANTSGENISPVVEKVQQAFGKRLFNETDTFTRTPVKRVRKMMKSSGMNLDQLRTKGWQGQSLAAELDVLVTGSVSSNGDGGYIIDVSFYRYDGHKIISQVAEAGSGGDWRIGRAVARIVDDVLERYPFEGLVTKVSDKDITVNLGSRTVPIGRKDIFSVHNVTRDERGLVTGSKEVAVYRMRKRRNRSSILHSESDTKVPTIRVGDKVVRLDRALAEREGSIEIGVRGGVGESKVPLSGVNIYVDGHWSGATGFDGRLRVPARAGRNMKLILYRHGFRQLSEKIAVQKEGEKFDFAMESYNSSLRLTSNPSGADVYIDGQHIGKSPIKKPFPVPLGFHTVKVSAGGSWRDWEEVVEFNDTEERLVGKKRVTLYRNYLASARRAQRKGKLQEAVATYQKVDKRHPDYTEATHRLAQLYLDELRDYDKAIAEFRKMTKIPEVRDLVYKQYSVVYTNLGHALYAKGDSLIKTDKTSAVKNFASAVRVLDKARENMRFFPSERYDEIAHDTYYYQAVSYHNIYVLTGEDLVRDEADLAWQRYFDFFPDGLRGRKEYESVRDAAEKLWQQVRAGLR